MTWRLRTASGIIVGVAFGIIPQAYKYSENTPSSRDEHAPIPLRVQDLLGRMTLEEKLAQLQSRVPMSPSGRVSKASALVEGWYVGQETGNSLAGFCLETSTLRDIFP
jgi:hypothetical protein